MFHRCGICFESKRTYFTKTLKKCGHIYCRNCLSDYFNMLIKEGDMFTILCPHETCQTAFKNGGSEIKIFFPELDDIKDLVDSKSFFRYESVIKEQLARLDPISYKCTGCRTYVYRKSFKERPSQFLKCDSNTCQLCSGEKSNTIGCLIEDSFKKIDKLNIHKMIGLNQTQYHNSQEKIKQTKVQDIKLRNQWLKKNAQPCPYCHTRFQMLSGCNHLVCPECKEHFCYKCGKNLQVHIACE